MNNSFNEQYSGMEPILERYIAILKVRSPVIFIFLGFLVVTALVATVVSTREYAAQAVVEVMPIAPKVMDVDEVETLGAGTKDIARLYYGTQKRIVKSNTVLQKALDKLRTEHNITSFDEEEKPLEALRDKMTLVMNPETTLFVIRIIDEDAEHAALFANVIATVYMQNNIERGQSAIKEALKWLEKEHERYRKEKMAADEKVHEYKFENDLVGIEEQYNSAMSRLRMVHELSNKTHNELLTIIAEYDQLKRQSKQGYWRVLAKEYGQEDQTLQSILLNEAALVQELNKLQVYYLPKHPEVKRIKTELVGMEKLIKQEVANLIEIKGSDAKILENQELILQEELKHVKEEIKDIDKKMIELEFLMAEATRNEMIYKDLDDRLSQVDLSQFMSANNIRFVDRAAVDFDHVRPNLVQNLLLAIILGLLGGGGLAFLFEFLDNSIKTTEDLENILGVPLLGVVPSIPPEDLITITSNRERSIYAYTRQRSPVAESLRSIRTNIKFRTGNNEQLTLLVTSAVPREGKSFMSSNLASVMAMSGQRVLLVDADLRRPSVHRLFDLSDEQGLSDVLLGEKSLHTVIQQSHVPNLDVVAAGVTPPNPNELLGGEIMKNLRSLAHEYDVVIIDSPPATAVADPMVLSPLVDGVVLVVEANETRRPVVQQAVMRLQNVNANLLGGVVNKFDSKKSGYGYYYYYADYGYYAEDDVDSHKIS
jgi:polysaccharide biosynthesis transport protein